MQCAVQCGDNNNSIVEVCSCTKCYTEPVAPETSPVYSCYLSKLEIKFRSNSSPVYHLLFIARMFAVVTLHNIKISVTFQISTMLNDTQTLETYLRKEKITYEIYQEERKIISIKKRKQNEDMLLSNKKQKSLLLQY